MAGASLTTHHFLFSCRVPVEQAVEGGTNVVAAVVELAVGAACVGGVAWTVEYTRDDGSVGNAQLRVGQTSDVEVTSERVG